MQLRRFSERLLHDKNGIGDGFGRELGGGREDIPAKCSST